MIDGVELVTLKKNVDDRGFFTELMRADWTEILGEDSIKQAGLSMNYLGVVRAWHQHLRGQIDYFIVIQGVYKVCAYDEVSDELDEFIISADKLQVIRIPGIFWHGYKCLSEEPSMILSFITNLYDYESPDEGRRPYDSVIDPKTGKKYVW